MKGIIDLIGVLVNAMHFPKGPPPDRPECIAFAKTPISTGGPEGLDREFARGIFFTREESSRLERNLLGESSSLERNLLHTRG